MMVIVPKQYIQFKPQYPGYFWDVENKRVCSLKSGVLQPIKSYVFRGQFRNYNMRVGETYSQISVDGKKHCVVFQRIQQYIDLNQSVLYHK